MTEQSPGASDPSPPPRGSNPVASPLGPFLEVELPLRWSLALPLANSRVFLSVTLALWRRRAHFTVWGPRWWRQPETPLGGSFVSAVTSVTPGECVPTVDTSALSPATDELLSVLECWFKRVEPHSGASRARCASPSTHREPTAAPVLARASEDASVTLSP